MDQLETIRLAAEERRLQQVDLDKADSRLRSLIRAGFALGFTGRQLAEASGLSLPRVYQIRDNRR